MSEIQKLERLPTKARVMIVYSNAQKITAEQAKIYASYAQMRIHDYVGRASYDMETTQLLQSKQRGFLTEEQYAEKLAEYHRRRSARNISSMLNYITADDEASAYVLQAATLAQNTIASIERRIGADAGQDVSVFLCLGVTTTRVHLRDAPEMDKVMKSIAEEMEGKKADKSPGVKFGST